MLAERVAKGDLEPVERRLPSRPLVLKPVERAGVYGGTWHTATLGPADVYWLVQCVGMETDTLTQWDYDLKDIHEQVAESFEVSKDATQYTFHLREGMRWSDGAPFTADDVVFAENDCNNYSKELSAAVGESPNPPRRAERLDDHTVRITLARPDALFMGITPTGNLQALINKPKHYLKRFHKKYNPQADALARKAGLKSWVELFAAKGSWDTIWRDPELPTVICAWVLKQGYGQGNRVIFERNPYYYKVDSNGAQLPYLDRVVFEVIDDAEAMMLKAMNGEFEMHMRHFNIPRNKPALARSRENGEYRFFNTQPGYMNAMLLMFNLSHKDPVKREVYNNRDFRVGLSYAIDRNEIIDAVFARQGKPWQAAPEEISEFYDKEFASQFTRHDVAEANRYLDKAGYLMEGDAKTRLGPDGNPIVMTVELATQIMPFWVDALELVSRYWNAVGIKTNIRSQDRSLLLQRNLAGESDVFAWWGAGGIKPMGKSGSYLASSIYLEFAPGWTEWYESGGESGMEPPTPAKEQFHLWDKLRATGEPAEQRRLMGEILGIAKEQFWIVGTVTYPPSYGIASNRLRNLPGTISNPADFKSPLDSCQFFLDT